MARRRIDGWITPLWLSHHYPENYDRCVRVGRKHICRRCIVLYPLAAAVMVAAVVADTSPGLLTIALVVLPLPAVVEWTLEHRGRIPYIPRLHLVLSAILGVGLGAGFARTAANRFDPVFWGVVGLDVVWCLAVAFLVGSDPEPDDAVEAAVRSDLPSGPHVEPGGYGHDHG